jgi:hypothetical protein
MESGGCVGERRCGRFLLWGAAAAAAAAGRWAKKLGRREEREESGEASGEKPRVMCCAALPLPERGEEEGAGDGSAELHVNSFTSCNTAILRKMVYSVYCYK